MFGRKRREAEAVDPVDILVVCTGNICRSPYIAELLRHRHPGLTVASAGTGALVGEPAAPPVQQLLAEQGIATAHVARQLTAPIVASARLLITATTQHRSYAAELDPTAANRAFTLKELARFLEGKTPQPGIDAVLHTGHEALMKDTFETNDDLSDPWQRPMEAYREMGVSVARALEIIDPWFQ